MSISGPRPVTQDTGQKKLYYMAGGGIAVLLLLALGVVFVLPESVGPSEEGQIAVPAPLPPPSSERPPAPKPAVQTAPETPATDIRRAAAEKRLGDVLRRQAALESDGVTVWGRHMRETSYGEVLDVLATANREFDAANYDAASAGFDRAIGLMDTLTAGKDARFEKAVRDGQQALADENAAAAEAAFRIAVALRPDDTVAEIGLARAQSLPDVLNRMREGRNLETAKDLDGAFAAYRGAAMLDPAYKPAAAAVARLQAVIADRDYRNAVTAALRGLDRKRFGDAAKAIAAARRIRPGAPEIRELTTRLRQERQIAAIEALRNRASTAEKNEDWSGAAAHYAAILSIDPSVAVAVAGRKRALEMATLHSQIETYLNDPDRLSSGGPLSHARQVLAAANGTGSEGLRLREKAQRLADLIDTASRPREVVLRSDGETAVTVYRVARLGKLTRRQLSLRPGQYTAVGTRPGYRDVRVVFRVPATGTETVVTVQCSERI